MDSNQALDFYETVTQGTKKTKTISLEADGAVLDGVEMSPVSKRVLASVIERLPDEMFDAVEGAEDAEEAEEELDESDGIGAVTEGTVEAFEDLLKHSLDHPSLTKPQMDQIVDEFNFEVLFQVGTDIINLSVEETGMIKDFREQP